MCGFVVGRCLKQMLSARDFPTSLSTNKGDPFHVNISSILVRRPLRRPFEDSVLYGELVLLAEKRGPSVFAVPRCSWLVTRVWGSPTGACRVFAHGSWQEVCQVSRMAPVLRFVKDLPMECCAWVGS